MGFPVAGWFETSTLLLSCPNIREECVYLWTVVIFVIFIVVVLPCRYVCLLTVDFCLVVILGN